MSVGRGDDGETDLLGGLRVHKSHPRIECIGEIDELSSFIGYSIALSSTRYPEITKTLSEIQRALFKIGAELSSVDKKQVGKKRLVEEDVKSLELLIDKYGGELAEVRHFVYPGGSLLGASLHIARAVARRAERRAVSLKMREEINPLIIKYLNRLSTLLFVLARYVNKMDGFQERQWID